MIWNKSAVKSVADSDFSVLGRGLLGFMFCLVLSACTKPTPPQAENDFNTTYRGKSIELDLLANDVDFGSRPMTLKLVSQPQHGSVELLDSGKVVYLPVVEHTGVDTFNYVVKGEGGVSAAAKVTIMVTPIPNNVAPEAENDYHATAFQKAALIDVLNNDHDNNPNDRIVLNAIVEAPQNGSVEIIDGKLLYQPAQDFYGEEQLRYSIRDLEGEIAEATLFITTASPEGDEMTEVSSDRGLEMSVVPSESDEIVEVSVETAEPLSVSETEEQSVPVVAAVDESVQSEVVSTVSVPDEEPAVVVPEKSTVVMSGSDNPSELVQQAFVCLEDGDSHCAISHCDRIAEVLDDSEMTSLCGTLFDPSIESDGLGSNPQQAFEYYMRAKRLGGDMSENLSRLSDWLISHHQHPQLRGEIQTALRD